MGTPSHSVFAPLRPNTPLPISSLSSFLFTSHHVGRGGSLVDWAPFVRRVAGSHPTLASTYTGTLHGQVLLSQWLVALRLETPTLYPCCVGSASVYSSG